jgi:hypothetical protein
MIEDLFEEAVRSDEQLREPIIRELASHIDETLETVLYALRGRGKVRWSIAAQVIRALGYPRNTVAIPVLVGHIGNKNSARWLDSMQMLVEMGAQVVVPHLVQILRGEDHDQHWGEDVEGICEMLCMVGREYAIQCGPVITHILGRADLPSPLDLDRGYLLDVLEKIGPESAVYALPTLIDFSHKEAKSEEGMRARRLIRSFSEEDRAPYALVLASLEETTEPNASN